MLQILCLLLSMIFALLARVTPRFHFLSFAVAMLALSFLVTAQWRF